jgi:hypothetical protein
VALTAPCIVHYTGHRITPRGEGGLDPRAEAALARAIAARLDRLAVLRAFGSLASGADILFAEAFVARRVALHVWLPFGIRRFQAISVRPAGAAWVARFTRVLSCAQVTILRGHAADEAAFAFCAESAMHGAVSAAASAQVRPLQLAVWNGKPASGAAGTAADVAMWRGFGLETDIVDVGA